MKFKKWRAATIAAAAAASLGLLTTPAQAGSADIIDAQGIDYDPACLVSTSLTPPAPNSINTSGCSGVSTYDGSAKALDFTPATVAVPATSGCKPGISIHDEIVITFPPLQITLELCIRIDWTLAAAGSTNFGDMDLPSANFVGANYFTLFQNTSTQTNVPTNPDGGCTRVGTGTPVYDQYGSWKDGYHFFVSFGVNWDGSKWIHSVQVGEYSPGPDGGFGFYELGTNDGNGWVSANPYHPYGTDWSVSIAADGSGSVVDIKAPAILKTPDTTNCQEGFFKHAFSTPGDTIVNIKGLSTANEVVTLPVVVPLSSLCGPSDGLICEDDLHTVGGFVFFADTTDGNSTAGALNTNISGIAYTSGAVGVTDTLGDGPTCPTPTFGGLLPSNPLFTPDTPCQIDDDPVSRGSFLSEFWDTTHGFAI